jgi:hypothetical protein
VGDTAKAVITRVSRGYIVVPLLVLVGGNRLVGGGGRQQGSKEGSEGAAFYYIINLMAGKNIAVLCTQIQAGLFGTLNTNLPILKMTNLILPVYFPSL